jgi:hypothetical protein
MGYTAGYRTTMTEPSRTVTAGLRPRQPPHRGNTQLDRLDHTLVIGNGEAGQAKVDDEVSDQESIELNSYRARPHSPVDFTR